MIIWFKLPNGHGADICRKEISAPKHTFEEEVIYWQAWARKALGKGVEIVGTVDGARCPWPNEKDGAVVE